MEFEYESSDEVSNNRDVHFWLYSSELEDWDQCRLTCLLEICTCIMTMSTLPNNVSLPYHSNSQCGY